MPVADMAAVMEDTAADMGGMASNTPQPVMSGVVDTPPFVVAAAGVVPALSDLRAVAGTLRGVLTPVAGQVVAGQAVVG